MSNKTNGPIPDLKVGDRVIWYDPRIWDLTGKDIENNDHCRQPATVVGIDPNGDGPGKPTVDLKFDWDENVSHGHFNYGPYGGRRIA